MLVLLRTHMFDYTANLASLTHVVIIIIHTPNGQPVLEPLIPRVRPVFTIPNNSNVTSPTWQRTNRGSFFKKGGKGWGCVRTEQSCHINPTLVCATCRSYRDVTNPTVKEKEKKNSRFFHFFIFFALVDHCMPCPWRPRPLSPIKKRRRDIDMENTFDSYYMDDLTLRRRRGKKYFNSS